MYGVTLAELDVLREGLRDGLCGPELDAAARGSGLRGHTASLSRSDLDRARVEVELARVISAVAASGEHREEGHTTVAAWCRATRRWSEAETRARVRFAELLAGFPDLADEMVSGRLGVAQAHTIAKAAANPRCGDEIGDALPILLEHADKMSHADFHRLVEHWERIADADGAHRDAERSHRQRRASWGTDDDSGDFALHLHCGGAQGAQIRAVLDVFADAEFHADWAACLAEDGDQATPDLLRRTDTQRRADAMVAMAAAAASAPADGQRPEPFVNIVVDHACVAEFLRHHANATSGDGHAERDEIANTGIANTGIANTRIANTGIEHLDFDVDDIDSGGRPDIDHAADRDARPPARVALAGDRRWRGCSTTDGHPLPVADAIAAMLVGRIRIVVIDERGVVLRMGRTQRLFTGKLREAVMLGAHECIWNGCNRPTGHCQADHITDWRRAGDTDVGSGAPLCAHHNRFKNHGFRVHRDVGHWHTYRPDGSEI